MKLGWCTDIHLDSCFKIPGNFESFVATTAGKYDAVVVTGDISNGKSIEEHLGKFVRAMSCPVYFVTGNHDAWYTSIKDLEARMSMFAARSGNKAVYLTERGAVPLTDNTALVGVSGWGDARWGAGEDTASMVNDIRTVADLVESVKSGYGLVQKMRWIADRDAVRLKKYLATAVTAGFKKIIIATHVPPFPGASFYRGERSSHDDLANYACRATCDVIIDAVHANTAVDFLVLCGHTHGHADYRPKGIDNLRVLAGEAEYKYPSFQEAIDVD